MRDEIRIATRVLSLNPYAEFSRNARTLRVADKQSEVRGNSVEDRAEESVAALGSGSAYVWRQADRGDLRSIDQ